MYPGTINMFFLMGIFSHPILIFASSGRCLKHFDFKSSLNSLWGCDAVLSNKSEKISFVCFSPTYMSLRLGIQWITNPRTHCEHWENSEF